MKRGHYRVTNGSTVIHDQTGMMQGRRMAIQAANKTGLIHFLEYVSHSKGLSPRRISSYLPNEKSAYVDFFAI